MDAKTRSLITTRDVVEDIDRILSCIGVAVTARPLQTKEMDGVLAILQWSGERLCECSRELAGVIDQLTSAPN